jgi:hypothetical protein
MGTGTVRGTQLQDLINQWSWSPQQLFTLTPPAADKDVRRSADELIRNKGALPPAVQQMVEGLLAAPQEQKFNTLQGAQTSNDILSRVVNEYSPQSIGSLGGPPFANVQPSSWSPDAAGRDEPAGTRETEETRKKKKEEPKDELGQQLLHAVAGQESGGDPTVINPDAASADGYGIGAIGRYQMLGSNVAAWSREAADAGKIPKSIADRLDADPRAITGMPKIQDEIAAFKMQQYYESGKDQGYSADDAVRFVAAAWYSGDGNNLNSDAPQAGYPSIRQYTEEVLEKFRP